MANMRLLFDSINKCKSKEKIPMRTVMGEKFEK
jgi:hypothetical protein